MYEKAIKHSKQYPDISSLNLRELDMRIIRHGQNLCKGYNVLIMCDERRRPIYGQVIVGVRESCHLLSFIENAKPYVELKSKFLVMDREFYNIEALKKLKKDEILPVVDARKNSENTKRTQNGKWEREKYVFDKEKNCFICPERNYLTYKGLKQKSKNKPYIHLYASSSRDCKNCKCRQKCLWSEKSLRKELTVNKEQELIIEHIEWMSTTEAKEKLKKRNYIVEGSIGYVKDEKRFNYKRFTLKGIKKAQIEVVLLLIGISIIMGPCRTYDIYFYFFCGVIIKNKY